MYAQLFTFNLGPGMRSKAEEIADKSLPMYKGMKGFKSITFIGDEEVGEYSALSIWDSIEDMKAAGETMGPATEKALRGIVKGAPTRRVFEVYEPKV